MLGVTLTVRIKAAVCRLAVHLKACVRSLKAVAEGILRFFIKACTESGFRRLCLGAFYQDISLAAFFIGIVNAARNITI